MSASRRSSDHSDQQLRGEWVSLLCAQQQEKGRTPLGRARARTGSISVASAPILAVTPARPTIP